MNSCSGNLLTVGMVYDTTYHPPTVQSSLVIPSQALNNFDTWDPRDTHNGNSAGVGQQPTYDLGNLQGFYAA